MVIMFVIWTTPPDFKGEMISHFAYSFATHLVLLDNNGKIDKMRVSKFPTACGHLS